MSLGLLVPLRFVASAVDGTGAQIWLLVRCAVRRVVAVFLEQSLLVRHAVGAAGFQRNPHSMADPLASETGVEL